MFLTRLALLQTTTKITPLRSLKSSILKKHVGAGGGITGKITGLDQTSASNKQILKYLFKHAWGNQDLKGKSVVAMSLACLFGAKLLNVQIPIAFKKSVDYFTERQTNIDLRINNYKKEKNKDNISEEELKMIRLKLEDDKLLVYLGAAAIGSICAFGAIRLFAEFLNESRNALFSTVSVMSIRRVSKDLFQKLHNLPLQWHLSKRTGAVVKAIDRGTRGANQLLKASVFNIFPTLVEMSLVYYILFMNCGADYANLALATCGVYAGFTIRTTSWRTPFRRQMNQADNEAGNLAVDSLTNYETVKLFNNEKFEADRYDQQLKKYAKANQKVEYSLAFLNFGQQAILTSGMFGLMYLAGTGIINGTQTIGDLVMVNGLLFQLSRPLGFLGSTYRDMDQSLTDLKHMMAIMELETLKNKENAISASSVIDPTGQVQPTINFENIQFGYDSSKELFSNLNFEIKSGQKVAIVGGSGSGKSTIVRLLFRFYNPQSGKISINNVNIEDMTVESLRENIGVVPQDCVLFHDTIYQNIVYGNLNATEEEVIAAAKSADLHESILKMKEGYNTIVGERGLKLSGGEKQRLAIARAMLKQPNIIIYDEATSALDSITEQNILKALKDVTQGKTTIVIAHRLSTIMDCDEIIVVGDDGSVAQKGSHDELLKSEGKYKTLWESQHFK